MIAALGAALLFAVQPAAAKALLPRLGGGPAAWGATLLFFQAILIAGYGLVDGAMRAAGPRGVRAAHLALLALATITLGVAPPFASVQDSPAPTIGAALATLATELFVPVLALTLTAPAIQLRVASTSVGNSRSAYALYAASNAGSLLGLLCYPWLLEPFVTLSRQWDLWSLGVWGFAALVVMLWATAGQRLPAGRAPTAAARPSGPLRWLWILRAAIPAALLAGVTEYCTRDIAPVPLLWVLPLALYLLTWVIAFSPRGRPLVRWASQAQDLAAVGALVLFLNQPYALAGPLLALVALVIVGLTQHGALAASAPEPGWLGRYYVLLAVGGALGTALVVLMGPALFPFPMETPLALAAAIALGRPQAAVSTSHGRLRFLAFGTVAMAVPLIGGVGREALLGSLAIGTGVAAMLWRGHPRRVALVLVGIVGLDLAVRLTAADLVATSHSILGRFAVRRDSSGVRLISGSTLHGLEPITPRGERPEAALYYTRRGPYGDVISLAAGRGTRWEFGVVGLGIGSLACTAPPGTKMTFFELNPGIVRLAHDTAIFRTLSSCAPGARIHLGDARLTLGTTSAQFDLLTIDAFNSDAIPTHLLTREALAVYRRRLKPGGIIAFHVSNRFLDLAPVVATVGADAGWVAVEAVPGPRRDPAGRVPTAPAADLVALAADSATLRPLVDGGRWRWRRSEGRPWTDDWTPLASALTLTRGNVFGK